MIRPGMQNPGVGAARTADLRRRLQQLMQQQRPSAPRLGGGMGRRPVAGPGVRQFSSGRGPLQPAALDALTARFGGEVVPFMRPTPGLPEQAQAGALDSLPDPAVGIGGPPQDVFHPLSSGQRPGPGAPITMPDYREQLGLNPGGTTPMYQGGLQQLGLGAGLETLIPLGGGAFFDTNSGQVFGGGGSRGSYAQ